MHLQVLKNQQYIQRWSKPTRIHNVDSTCHKRSCSNQMCFVLTVWCDFVIAINCLKFLSRSTSQLGKVHLAWGGFSPVCTTLCSSAPIGLAKHKALDLFRLPPLLPPLRCPLCNISASAVFHTIERESVHILPFSLFFAFPLPLGRWQGKNQEHMKMRHIRSTMGKF